jgi:hypothetical protein
MFANSEEKDMYGVPRIALELPGIAPWNWSAPHQRPLLRFDEGELEIGPLLVFSPTSRFHMFFSPPPSPSPINGEGIDCNPLGFPSLDGRG